MEIIAAVIRGCKHWSYEKVENLWDFLLPLLSKALLAVNVETLEDWGTCMATAVVRSCFVTVTRRDLGPKFFPQVLLGSLLGTRWSAIGQFVSQSQKSLRKLTQPSFFLVAKNLDFISFVGESWSPAHPSFPRNAVRRTFGRSTWLVFWFEVRRV